MARVGLLSVMVLALAGTAWAQEPNDPGLAVWSLFNSDQFVLRAGWSEKHFEAGIEGIYRDDLAPDEAQAYAVGVYGLYLVNPDAQFPLRGWIPGNLQFLPEFLPISLYLGAKCDLEFQGHKLMPAFLLGGYVRTGAHGSVGVEWQHAFTNWENVAKVTDSDVFLACLRFRF